MGRTCATTWSQTMAKPDFLPLFPPYLDPGSRGDAVHFMQQLLSGMGYQTPHGLHRGDSVTAVKRLQIDLGFAGDDVDGGFGPSTRERFKERTGIDVDRIPAHVGHETFWYGPEHEGERRYAGS